MADQEFERIVQEGMAALKKSRERLNSDWDKPRAWEEITPEPLKQAVKHIRREFETAAWQVGEQVECGCYISLHPELATLPRYKGRENLIRADLRETWHLQFEGMNEAERFANWVKQYSDILKKNVAAPFNAFLKIGLANQSILPMPPVDWAKTLTKGLLYSLKWTVPHLIKRMCDQQERKLDINVANFDAECGWVWWRAPQFVHMHPSGNSPFNAATVWHRADDAEFTETLLRGLTGKMVEPAWFRVDHLAGEADVSLASVPHTEPSVGVQKQPNPNSARGTIGADKEIAQAQDRVRRFESEIAAIDTKIAAFQQSLTQAIVNGTSTFRPRDISKAISKLHADRKELELRRDDWQLMLQSALSRIAVPTQQEASLTPPIAGNDHGAGLAGANDTDGTSMHGTVVPSSALNSPVVPLSHESMTASPARSAQPDKGKLPAKTTDLSKYLEGAGLTDRQRECFSLKFEYGLRVSAIVNRLGLSRKTVDEHIAAAKRRIGWSQIKEKQKANSARLNPGE
jgi:DNA-binding CsgD family transcriptional regulator